MSKKITTIGGGTGQYTLLRGLKNYDTDLTSIVSMMDDGGSSGKLRDEFGVLPPGDLRRCLVALSREFGVLRELFEYRFGKDCVGNMIIAALQDIVGKENYVKETSKILDTAGLVLPITVNETNIYAETNKGNKLKGQLEVSYKLDKDEKIKEMWLDPNAYVYKEAAGNIRNSDMIVICPGDLYGSILPNFLVEGVKQAIKKSEAKLVYVCNLVTKQGTYGFSADDFIKEIEKYIEKEIGYIVVNKKRPTERIVDKYKGEGSYFVEPSTKKTGKEIIEADLLSEHKINGRIIARHNPTETAKIIMKLINK